MWRLDWISDHRIKRNLPADLIFFSFSSSATAVKLLMEKVKDKAKRREVPTNQKNGGSLLYPTGLHSMNGDSKGKGLPLKLNVSGLIEQFLTMCWE